jgi:hypothetical protein
MALKGGRYPVLFNALPREIVPQQVKFHDSRSSSVLWSRNSVDYGHHHLQDHLQFC